MPRLVRDRLTWVMYAQLALWVYFMYGFGPVAPILRDELHISRGLAGLHGTAFALGGVLGSLMMTTLTRRLGRARLIWIGLACISTAALGMYAAHHLALTLTFATLASVGSAFTVNAINTALTDHHGPAAPAAISEANAAAAAVGLVAPLVVGATYAAGWGWRSGLAVVVVPALAVAWYAWRTGVKPPEPAGFGRERVPHRPLPEAFWLALTSLFATGAIEICLTLWGSEVLREHAHVSAGVATAGVSALIAGMVVGRLVGGRLLLVFRPSRMLLVALGVCLAGFAVFWLATLPWLAMAGLALTGTGMGLHYPLGMSLALAHSDGQPDLAAARTSFAVGVAFGVAPFALGALADRVGPHPAFLLVPLFAVVSAAAIVRLDRITSVARSSGRPPAAAAPIPPARPPARTD
ncbi:MFS transporter [Dactylosporangium sp. CS-033363]|uniref:MFS transporter n=1 Tax=Dactylosporangium sp. CS-033363 TaxID=3239935 RepID=UPI003D8F1431